MSIAKVRQKKTPTAKSRRAKLSADESLKRISSFAKRKENFIATLRKGKDRTRRAV